MLFSILCILQCYSFTIVEIAFAFRLQAYDTATYEWIDMGYIPGQVTNSQPIPIPGIPAKLLVPIDSSVGTTSPALLFTPTSNTWETVFSDNPINIYQSCAVNFNSGKYFKFMTS
jgi:hypothetical protein